MPHWKEQLDIFKECRAFRLPLWQCPPFLILVMGFITVISMVGTYAIATRYTQEPQIAALIVIGVALLFVIMSNLLIAGFNRIAEAHRMKSEFISIVSHQLRSPLSIFKWTLDVLEKEVKRHDDRTRFPTPPAETADTLGNHSMPHFIRTLTHTTEVMIRLVNSLLEVNRIEANRLLLQKEPLSLAELTKSVLDDFAPYANALNVAFTFAPPPSLPAVIGDHDRVRMVIQNLVDNAVRYSTQGGTVAITLETKPPCVTFRIQDRGVGIPAAEQKNVFRKFFRAPNGLRFQTEGTGIGLYIAKATIEGLGGAIGFTSKEKEGSTFWFTLPVAI